MHSDFHVAIKTHQNTGLWSFSDISFEFAETWQILCIFSQIRVSYCNLKCTVLRIWLELSTRNTTVSKQCKRQTRLLRLRVIFKNHFVFELRLAKIFKNTLNRSYSFNPGAFNKQIFWNNLYTILLLSKTFSESKNDHLSQAYQNLYHIVRLLPLLPWSAHLTYLWIEGWRKGVCRFGKPLTYILNTSKVGQRLLFFALLHVPVL